MIQNDIPAMPHDASGRGEPLVLLPGGLTGWLSWIPHVETLAGYCRVFRLQLLNVELGLAGVPLPPAYSIDFEAAALRRTLDELAVTGADLVGWSYGSLIALSFALHHPQSTRSLTLIEPSAFWILRSRGAFSQQLLDEQMFFHTLATDQVTEDQLIELMRILKLVPDDVDPRTLPQWPVWLEHRQSLRIGDIEYRYEDDLETLRAFRSPVLLVNGAGSNPHVHAISAALAEELPNARVLTLPGGHAPHIDSIQSFLEVFIRFLSEREEVE